VVPEAFTPPVPAPPVPLLVVPPLLLPQATANAPTASKAPRRPNEIKLFMCSLRFARSGLPRALVLTVRFDPKNSAKKIGGLELSSSYRDGTRRCKNFARLFLSTCQSQSDVAA